MNENVGVAQEPGSGKTCKDSKETVSASLECFEKTPSRSLYFEEAAGES